MINTKISRKFFDQVVLKIKILHTSDWHIGRKLHERDRYDEMQKFFSWLELELERENINALIISGDIFDNTTPSNQAREIYYSFLARVAKSSCRHVIIIAGNHDSANFLEAPAKTLELLDIHVIGQITDNIDDEIITLEDSNGNPELIVCAVPFLRDRDVRTANSENNLDSRQQDLINGIHAHYQKVFERSAEIRGDSKIPVVATGHLFIEEAKAEGEEHRELYLGTIIKISLKSGIFPAKLVDYVALGHLHSKSGSQRVRYSGSPIPMTFSEASHKKYVEIVEFDENCKPKIQDVQIPTFRKLARIKGDWQMIDSRISEYVKSGEAAWLEITYTGQELLDIRERIEKKLKFFPELEALTIYNETREKLNSADPDDVIIQNGKTLDEILPEEIFKLKLKANKIPDEQQDAFMSMYREILDEIQHA